MVHYVKSTDLDEVTITENAGHKLEVLPAGVIAAIVRVREKHGAFELTV